MNGRGWPGDEARTNRARAKVVWERMPRPRATTRLLVRLLARSRRLYGLAKTVSRFGKRIDTGLLARADALLGLRPDVRTRGHLREVEQYWLGRDLTAARERIEVISSYLRVAEPISMPLVRVGGEGDGGYVMIRDMAKTDFFLSLGVGRDVSWDQEVASIGSGIHLYDDTVESLPDAVEGAVFYRERISAQSGRGMATLSECIGRTPDQSDLILKMDIEGSEWEVLAAAEVSDLRRCRQIAVEFHDLIWALIDPDKYSEVISSLTRISRTHQPVYLHANNVGNYQVIANVPVPDVIEVTYARRSDYRFREPPRAPQAVARPNDVTFPDIVLAFPVPVPFPAPAVTPGDRDDPT